MKKMLKRIAALVCIMSLTCITLNAYASTTSMYCERCSTVKQWSVSCIDGDDTYISNRMHYYTDSYGNTDTCNYEVYYKQYCYKCSCGNTRLGSVHPCFEVHFANLHGVGVVPYHN